MAKEKKKKRKSGERKTKKRKSGQLKLFSSAELQDFTSTRQSKHRLSVSNSDDNDWNSDMTMSVSVCSSRHIWRSYDEKIMKFASVPENLGKMV